MSTIHSDKSFQYKVRDMEMLNSIFYIIYADLYVKHTFQLTCKQKTTTFKNRNENKNGQYIYSTI